MNLKGQFLYSTNCWVHLEWIRLELMTGYREKGTPLDPREWQQMREVVMYSFQLTKACAQR